MRARPLILVPLLWLSPASADRTHDAEAQRPCVQMIESWYAVDPGALEDILHPHFVKTGVIANPTSGEWRTVTMDRDDFVAAVGSERDPLPRSNWDIRAETVERTGPIATVRVESVHLVDVCQAGLVDGRWQVMNVLWTFRERDAG